MSNDVYASTPTKGSAVRVRIFYSYSTADQTHQEALEKHLAILRQTGSIEEWHKRKISVGEHRDRRIKKELVKADIILLLLTPDFIASEYCYSTEMKFAIKAYEEGLAIVIPLLIRASSWQETPLAELQALPRKGANIYEKATAATSESHFDTLVGLEWQKIAEEIAEKVKLLLESPDDLLENRQKRLDLQKEERDEVRQGNLPEATRIPRLEKKKTLPLLLIALVVLLMMGFGGVFLEFHSMLGGTHVAHGSVPNVGAGETASPSAGLTAITTMGVTPTATDTPTSVPATPTATTATGGLTSVPTKTPTPQRTFPETPDGNASTWTNYSNAGGNPGLVIRSNTTVQITCKVTGFKVQDGDTWWYRIASSPWNNAYYASADAFYNNGKTTGPLTNTPFVDNKVPNC